VAPSDRHKPDRMYLGIRAVVRRCASGRRRDRQYLLNCWDEGQFGIGAYMASKWSVHGMTKAAALELARDNIASTRFTRRDPHPGLAAGHRGVRGGARKGLAIPRAAEPEEITRLVLFAAPPASFSTGSEFIDEAATCSARCRTPACERDMRRNDQRCALAARQLPTETCCLGFKRCAGAIRWKHGKLPRAKRHLRCTPCFRS